MKFQCNLDTPVKVKLTSRGEQVIQAVIRTISQSDSIKLKQDKEGYITMTLWQFAQHYGGILATQNMIENNSIYFEVPDAN